MTVPAHGTDHTCHNRQALRNLRDTVSCVRFSHVDESSRFAYALLEGFERTSWAEEHPLNASTSKTGDLHESTSLARLHPGPTAEEAGAGRLSVVTVDQQHASGPTISTTATSAVATAALPAAAPVVTTVAAATTSAGEHRPLLFPKPQSFWVRTVVAHSRSASAQLRTWQAVIKRCLDIGVGLLLLLCSLPILTVAALAIKVYDGGPVLYRQTRVGRNGRHFTILKLRTMVPDADKHLHRLAGDNVRTGPLFKMLADPRVTPVGRLLRPSSIDELPQLLNVIAGSMSLVGPRPALPHEVAQFDTELMRRLGAKPGLTGLWQVEARDDPAFERYQTLDLYYVSHQTLRLDLAILLSTVRPVLHRLYRSVRREASALRPGRGEAGAVEILD